MLFQIIEVRCGQQKCKMVDSFKNCLAKLKSLKASNRGQNVEFYMKGTDDIVKFEEKAENHHHQ